jgi:hypothetical protein
VSVRAMPYRDRTIEHLISLLTNGLELLVPAHNCRDARTVPYTLSAVPADLASGVSTDPCPFPGRLVPCSSCLERGARRHWARCVLPGPKKFSQMIAIGSYLVDCSFV